MSETVESVHVTFLCLQINKPLWHLVLKRQKVTLTPNDPIQRFILLASSALLQFTLTGRFVVVVVVVGVLAKV